MHLCIFFYFLFILNFLYGDYLFAFIFQEFERLFEYIGGFDVLYRKMLACGIPTAVHLMWIPLSELSVHQRISVILRFPLRFLSGRWNSETVLTTTNLIFDNIKEMTDDIMTVIGFPIVEYILPNPVSLSPKLAIC